MSRGLVGWDRFVSLVVGLALLAVGVGAIAWYAGRFPRVGPTLDVGWLPDTTHQGWWPWACAVAGVLLVLLGLRWLVAHLPRRRSGTLALDGSGQGGRLEVELGVVAGQAAQALGALPGVTSAGSHVTGEPAGRKGQGRHLLELDATMARDGDLAEVAAAVDQVVADLARVLDPGCPPVRSWIRVSRS